MPIRREYVRLFLVTTKKSGPGLIAASKFTNPKIARLKRNPINIRIPLNRPGRKAEIFSYFLLVL